MKNEIISWNYSECTGVPSSAIREAHFLRVRKLCV